MKDAEERAVCSEDESPGAVEPKASCLLEPRASWLLKPFKLFAWVTHGTNENGLEKASCLLEPLSGDDCDKGLIVGRRSSDVAGGKKA